MVCACGIRSYGMSVTTFCLMEKNSSDRSMIICGQLHFGLRVLSQIYVVQVTLYYILYDGEKSGYYKPVM